MSQFETLFGEKTGNRWGSKKFEKVPGKFYPLEIDYGGEEDTNMLAEAGAASKLAPEIQELVKMIFNVETMKKALLEFEVNPMFTLSHGVCQSEVQKVHGFATETWLWSF